MSCKYCGRKNNDFVLLNDTAEYSDLEISVNRQGMLRARYHKQGKYDLFFTQDIVNINFCPICGRRLAEEE
jgi:hypothetical protein